MDTLPILKRFPHGDSDDTDGRDQTQAFLYGVAEGLRLADTLRGISEYTGDCPADYRHTLHLLHEQLRTLASKRKD